MPLELRASAEELEKNAELVEKQQQMTSASPKVWNAHLRWPLIHTPQPQTLLRRNVVTASPPHSFICCHVQEKRAMNDEVYEHQKQLLSLSPKV